MDIFSYKNEINDVELIELEKLETLLLKEGWVTKIKYPVLNTTNLSEKREAVFRIIQNKYIFTAKNKREILRKIKGICDRKADILLLTSQADYMKSAKLSDLHLKEAGHSCIDGYQMFNCRNVTAGSILMLLMIYKQITDEITSISYLENNEETNVNSTMGKHSPEDPMLIKVIIHEIFKFLHLGDIKNCRTVCRTWNAVAESLYAKRSTIRFQTLRPATFIDMYRNSSFDIPFRNFKFIGGDKYNQSTIYPYIVSKMQEFFETVGDCVKCLTLEDIAIRDRDEGSIMFYNISSWTSHTINLTTLTIRCKINTATKFCVPLHQLKSIQNIDLNYCHVTCENTNANFRITPRKMSLKNVGYHNGEFLTPWCVNDYVDVSNASEICIVGPCGPTFDMGRDIIEAQKVFLRNTQIMNWESARGNIKLLKLHQSCAFPFLRDLKVKIGTLDFEWSKRSFFGTANAIINLATFPKMVEKIHLSTDLQIICSERIQLPNLKALHVDANHLKHYNVIFYFDRCENLRDLELHDSDFSDRRIKQVDVNTIPARVNKLKLQSEILSVVEGDQVKQLETLILIDYSWRGAAKVMSTLVPNVLILKLPTECTEPNDIIFFIQQWNRLENIIVGPIKLDAESFEQSHLPNYVQQEASYYEFKGQKGKPLTLEQFNSKLWL